MRELWQKASLNTRIVWGVNAGLIVVDAVGLKAEDIWLAFHAIMLPKILAVMALLGLSMACARYRRNARLAVMTHLTAAFLTFSAALSVLCYLSVGWQRPLVDEYLVTADHALGLDWLACYQWVAAHPLVYKTLNISYYSLLPQTLLLPLLLGFIGRGERGWEMLRVFMVAGIIGVVIAGVWPAVGAFGYYHVEENRAYIHVFMALHNGSLKIIGNNPLQGVLQFPSFHAALAIIFTYAGRGIKILFPFLLVLNVLLFLATPAIGGHHFADLWAGILLALCAIVIVKETGSFHAA